MSESTFSSEILEQLVEVYLEETQPSVVALTVPFPGNMLGALRIAQTCKDIAPDIPIVMGGGFVNTELRALKDPRVFEFVDFICVDDGERPFMTLLEYFDGKREVEELVRTYFLAEDQDGEPFVYFNDNKALHDIPKQRLARPFMTGYPWTTI